MNGNTPGDGKTSPFGAPNQGGGNGNMAGNDFGKNPGGTRAPGATPTDFTKLGSRPQASGTDPTNTSDSAKGGPIPVDGMTPPANRPGGVGTVGSSAKPFRLSGGG